jgi:ABC-type uncharacterized transport system involved in gliding motility auxiliary subunit
VEGINMDKNKMPAITFIAGICLLVFGSAAALVAGEFTLFSIVPLALGALAAGIYAVMNRKQVAEIFKSRGARYGINSAVYTLLVIAIIVVVQAIFTVNSAQLDLTKNKLHTLSDETKNVLAGVKTDINAYYFYSIAQRNGAVEDTLNQYAALQGKFKTESIDADKNPAFAKRYNVDRYNLVVLVRKDTGVFEKVDMLTEEGLTNALIRLTKGEKKKVYFTKGHGEPAIDGPMTDKTGLSALAQELSSYNYQPLPLELFSAPAGVPADCSLLVIAGAQIDLFDAEVNFIKQYLGHGGKMLVFYPAFTNTPKLAALVKAYGVNVQNDVVIDKMGRMFGGDELMPIISSYEQHDITKTFRVATFFPVCRTFDLKPGISGVVLSPVAKTNPGAFGETDLLGVKKGVASFDAKADYASPLTVAAVIDADNAMFRADASSVTNSSHAKIALLGSFEMADNSFLNASGNKDFVVNTVNYLAGQGDLISIRPKSNSFEPIFLSKITGRLLFLIPVVFMPIMVIAIGVLVFIRRRMS